MSYSRGRPTTYKGIRMRSRLEATFAAWLDDENLSWCYEPECFADATGQYLPDFSVTVHSMGVLISTCYFEVKPPVADTSAALLKMHIIRSSRPEASLYVVVPTGTYPNQGWVRAGTCVPPLGCSHCNPFLPAFRDSRTIAGADRQLRAS